MNKYGVPASIIVNGIKKRNPEYRKKWNLAHRDQILAYNLAYNHKFYKTLHEYIAPVYPCPKCGKAGHLVQKMYKNLKTNHVTAGNLVVQHHLNSAGIQKTIRCFIPVSQKFPRSALGNRAGVW